MPRILSPFDRVEEVEPLAAAGAHELYGGVQPQGWVGRGLSATQRTFASAHFGCEASFAEAAAEAARFSLPVHLTLNAPLYDPAWYPALLGLAERAAGWGVAGVIAGDPGLLFRLREASLPLEVTLSTMAGALNRWSIAFFQAMGIRRVVLPRHLTLAEVQRIVESHPCLAFEAFVLIGKCPNEEAHCTFEHVSPTMRWPCEIPYDLEAAGQPLSPDHPLARWHASWRLQDRRLACGLCAVPELWKAGVRYLKLVGRGGPTEGKVANVRLAARVLSRLASRGETRAAYEERFGRPCHPLVCYFPELHPCRG